MHLQYDFQTANVDEVTYQPNADEVVTLALVIRNRFTLPAGQRQWFGGDDRSVQTGYLHLPAGNVIQPHRYQVVGRVVRDVTACLLVRRGALRADFYGLGPLAGRDGPVACRELEAGDLLIHLCGGWGFTATDDCELFEFKSGPYLGAHNDKERL
jgi:hypothetical protein